MKRNIITHSIPDSFTPIYYRKKNIGSISIFCNYNSGEKSSIILRDLTRTIRDTEIGYAGFRRKRDLLSYLDTQLFIRNKTFPSPTAFNQKEIKKIIARAVRDAYRLLPQKYMRIFFFPTSGYETYGASGYCPWTGAILVYGNPISPNFNEAIRQTIAHEYNHSFAFSCRTFTTVLDKIIFEGSAIKFQEDAVGGAPTPWSRALSDRATGLFIQKIKTKLKSRDWSDAQKILFGGGAIPKWAGYSAGYRIVCRYTEKETIHDWKKIFSVSPEDILSGSGFI